MLTADGEGRRQLEHLHKEALLVARRAIEDLESTTVEAKGTVPGELSSRSLTLSESHAKLDESELKVARLTDRELFQRIVCASAHISNAESCAGRQLDTYNRSLEQYWSGLPLWEKLLTAALFKGNPPRCITPRALESRMERYRREIVEIETPATDAFHLAESEERAERSRRQRDSS